MLSCRWRVEMRRWWRSTFCTRCQRAKAAHARKGSFPPGYTAAGCSSPQCTHEGELGDGRRSSPVSQLLSYHPQSIRPSFDPCRDQSVLRRVTDTVFMCLPRDWHVSVDTVSHRMENFSYNEFHFAGSEAEPVRTPVFSDCVLQKNDLLEQID